MHFLWNGSPACVLDWFKTGTLDDNASPKTLAAGNQLGCAKEGALTHPEDYLPIPINLEIKQKVQIWTFGRNEQHAWSSSFFQVIFVLMFKTLLTRAFDKKKQSLTLSSANSPSQVWSTAKRKLLALGFETLKTTNIKGLYSWTILTHLLNCFDPSFNEPTKIYKVFYYQNKGQTSSRQIDSTKDSFLLHRLPKSFWEVLLIIKPLRKWCRRTLTITMSQTHPNLWKTKGVQCSYQKDRLLEIPNKVWLVNRVP